MEQDWTKRELEDLNKWANSLPAYNQENETSYYICNQNATELYHKDFDGCEELKCHIEKSGVEVEKPFFVANYIGESGETFKHLNDALEFMLDCTVYH